MKGIVTKTLMGLMIAAGLFVLVFGPRSRAGGPDNRVHIQYWEKWTGHEGAQMKEIVDQYNATVGKEKGIFVDFVSMSQIDRKTLISTAAGVPPDVAGLWDAQVLQFASMNALEPLDDYAGRFGMTRDKYKPVFYDSCKYQNKLYAIPSTVWCIAMLWNKAIFQEKSAELRAAGLNPDEPPKTIAELDRYAAAIDTWEGSGNRRRLALTGFIPLEPGTATNVMPYWFGSPIADPSGTRLLLNSPEMLATYNWIRGYSERLGKDQLAEFRSGFSTGATGLFDTPQNPFLVGWNTIEAQGPWISAFIEKYDPGFDRWHVPAEQVQRETDFSKIQIGMSRGEVEAILGTGDSPSNALSKPPAVPEGAQLVHWAAGIKDIFITFDDGKVTGSEAKLIPAHLRQKYCQWGAAAFPSAVPGLKDVTYAGFDVWVIPSTSKHKKEAFDFIAYASEQAQIEKLAMEHCNLSPLKDETPEYKDEHPNPYVDVYERLAASPNARGLPRIVNWPQIADELSQAAERSSLFQGSTQKILSEIQTRAERIKQGNGPAGR